MTTLSPKQMQILTALTGRAILTAKPEDREELRRIHRAIIQAQTTPPPPARYEFSLN